MVVRVHADDLGRTQAINHAIFDAYDNGLLTGASVLVGFEAFTDAIRAWEQRPGLELRLHFNLTEGPSIAKADDVALLVNSNGQFKYSPLRLALQYYLSGRRMRRQIRAQIRTEFRAQLSLLRREVGPDWVVRIDSHQHVHMLPFVSDALMRELADTSVAYMRVVSEPLYLSDLTWRPSSLINALAGYVRVVVMGLLSYLLQKKLQQTGISYSNVFIGFFKSGNMTIQTVESGLAAANRPRGGLEILFHPGGFGPEECDRTSEVSHFTKFYCAPERNKEKSLLMSVALDELLHTYRDGCFVPRSWQSRVSVHLGQVTRFMVTGVVAATVHLGLLWVLTEWLHIWYVLSSVIGFLCGFVVSFSLQKFWTFGDREYERLHQQVIGYGGLQSLGLLTNVIGLYALVEFVGVWYVPAQILVLLVVAVVTFLISRNFIFTSERISPLVTGSRI